MRWLAITATVLAAILIGLVTYIDWRDRELPITELPDGLHSISPEEWYGDEKRHRLYQTTGWVLLPRTPASQPTIPEIPGHPIQPSYIGPMVCAECHQERYESFVQTAHAKTSGPVSREAVHGSFEPGKNRVETRDPRLGFTVMEKEDGFYQKVIVERDDRSYGFEQRIDIVTGSANHGQSFLYWKDDRLYELPVTYFTAADRWMNSPGYPDGTADFARPINARCLECHSTYFEYVAGTENQFVPEMSILGVTCERCHGPGRDHASYHRDHPDDTEARHIVHPALLSRQRLIEVCAQCHSGVGKARLKPPFTYRPGENLAEFMIIDQHQAQQAGGVHTANQLGRLSMSRCFKESDDLTCVSCHDPHQNEHAKSPIFSDRCMKCHEMAQCGAAAAMGASAGDDCISCHMPLRKDAKIRLKGPQEDQLPLIRDHFIRIFPHT